MRTSNQVTHESVYHVAWATKYRRPLLVGAVESDLKSIIAELAAEKDVRIIELTCQPDHLYIIVDVHPQYGIDEFVKNAKGRTSRYLRATYPDLKSKVPSLWTKSYFVATAGSDPTQAVREYISEQKLRGEA